MKLFASLDAKDRKLLFYCTCTVIALVMIAVVDHKLLGNCIDTALFLTLVTTYLIRYRDAKDRKLFVFYLCALAVLLAIACLGKRRRRPMHRCTDVAGREVELIKRDKLLGWYS